MFESTGTGVAQLHEDAVALAAGVDVNVSGAEADEALAEVLAAGRQLDLLTCRLIERVDRSGQFAVDGAASTTAFSAAGSTNAPNGSPNGSRSGGHWPIGCR